MEVDRFPTSTPAWRSPAAGLWPKGARAIYKIPLRTRGNYIYIIVSTSIVSPSLMYIYLMYIYNIKFSLMISEMKIYSMIQQPVS